MGVLKNILEKLFGETVKKEEKIEIDDIDVEIVSFTDNNGKYHERGYKPINTPSLRKLLKRMIEVRGDEGDFNDIDTSKIKDMMMLFYNNETFNGNISGWDVSKVLNMDYMFFRATSFNQNISNWKIYGAKAVDMFYKCPIKDEFKPKIMR